MTIFMQVKNNYLNYSIFFQYTYKSNRNLRCFVFFLHTNEKILENVYKKKTYFSRIKRKNVLNILFIYVILNKNTCERMFRNFFTKFQ